MNAWIEGNTLLAQTTLVSLLLACSLQVPFRWGVFSFAGLGAYTIGAYGAAILLLRTGASTWVAIGLASLMACVVCYGFSFLVARLGGLYLGMATIAFDLILTVLVQNGGPLTGKSGMLFGVLGDITSWQIALVCAAACATLAYTERGRLGRQVEAASTDPQLALAMGIKVQSFQRASFAISGLLGGLAGGIGVMIATTVQPSAVGFHLIITALTMITVGGSRSWVGALIGAIIITWLPEVLGVAQEWRLVIFGGVVTLLAVWLPEGILGLLISGIRRARPAPSSKAGAPSALSNGTAAG